MNDTALDPETMTISDIKKVVAETTLQLKETDRLIKELREEHKEMDRQMKESAQRMEESDRKFKEKMNELNSQFISQSGHIIEGLMEPSAMKMFKDKGYDIDRCWKNFSKYDKSMGKKLEVGNHHLHYFSLFSARW